MTFIQSLYKLTIFSTISVISFVSINATVAGQFPDGTVFFDQSPTLEKVSTTRNNVYVWGATYYFTIQLPSNSGEGLQKLVIEQKVSPDEIDFNLDDTVAFLGNSLKKGDLLSLATVTQEAENNSQITIILENPIPPGSTFTIGLKPVKNPRYAGTYQFGVTAFPNAEKSQGLYLGVGRLQFYSDPGVF